MHGTCSVVYAIECVIVIFISVVVMFEKVLFDSTNNRYSKHSCDGFCVTKVNENVKFSSSSGVRSLDRFDLNQSKKLTFTFSLKNKRTYEYPREQPSCYIGIEGFCLSIICSTTRVVQFQRTIFENN